MEQNTAAALRTVCRRPLWMKVDAQQSETVETVTIRPNINIESNCPGGFSRGNGRDGVWPTNEPLLNYLLIVGCVEQSMGSLWHLGDAHRENRPASGCVA